MARRRSYAVAGPSRISGKFVLRLLVGVFVLLVVIFVALAGVGAALTYYVITAKSAQEAVTPQSYLLNSYIPLNFNDRYGGEHEGWLLLGLRGAPAIILCPGYDSNRSDLLSLGSILRDNHFNVYIFNFHGPKAKESRSDLGPRQASDLFAAIETVTKQPDINPNRVGLFGTSVGGYAALVAAELNPKVKALVVDTTYSTPEQMFDLQIEHLLGGSTRAFPRSHGGGVSPRHYGRRVLRHACQPAQARERPQAFYFRARQSSFGGDDRGTFTIRRPNPSSCWCWSIPSPAWQLRQRKRNSRIRSSTFFLQNLSLRAN